MDLCIIFINISYDQPNNNNNNNNNKSWHASFQRFKIKIPFDFICVFGNTIYDAFIKIFLIKNI